MKNLYTLFIITLFTTHVFGQGAETTVTGKVLDATNTPVAGVIVVAKDNNTGFETSTSTNNIGQFMFKELSVGGPYAFTLQYVGFNTVKLTGYTLRQGSKIELGEITITEKTSELDSVVIMANTSTLFTGRKDVGEALIIGRKVLNQIPTQSRDFKILANYSSQSTVPASKTERYGISIAGVKSTGIGYTIDGVNARRGVFGGTSTDAAFIISMEAVEEFKVETDNYSVVGPRNGGGSIKAITRKGTNKFGASAWSYYTGNNLSQSKDFSGNKIGGVLGNSFNNYQFGVRLSGPIIKDKLTYFAVYDRYTQDAPDGTSLLNYDVFSASEQQNITKADTERLLSILKNNNVIEDGTLNGQTGTYQKNDVTQNFFIRFDLSLNKIHKVIGRFSYLDYVGTYNATNVFVNYMIKDRRQGWANRSFKGLLNLKSNFSSGAYNDLKINISTDNRFLTTPGVRYPSSFVRIGDSGLAFGAPWWGGEEIYSTQYQLIDDYTFTTNNGWNVTLGTNNLMHSSREFYPHFTGSVIGYNSIDDLENNRSSSWTSLIPTDGKPAKRYYEYPLIETSVYAQFSKSIFDGFNLEVGLRWDGYIISEKSVVNPDLEAVGIKTTNGFSDFNNFQPRLSLTWDVKDKGTDIVKFGVGAFSNEITTHGYTFALRGNGIDYKQITVNANSPQAAQDLVGQSWKQNTDSQPTAEQLNAAGVNVGSTPTDIVTLDPDFQAPMTWKTNLTYTHYFADWVRGSISGYFNRTYKQSYFEDLNLKPRTDANGANILSADGRLMYEKKYSNFNQIIQYKNADWVSQYLATTLEVGFIYKEGLLNFSYTFADSQGEAPYGAGSAWLQGQGIGASYEDYLANVGNSSGGYVANNKIVALLVSPTYYGFSLSGVFSAGQYERFSIRTTGDINGIANEGGGDGRVQAGDMAFIYNPDDANTPASVANDMRTVLNNTSAEYKEALLQDMGKFASQNSGKQPWQYETNLTLKKVFNFNDSKLTFRMDLFNIMNLLDSTSGYNYLITNLNLYNIESDGTIKVNTDAGKKVKAFIPSKLFRLQFGLKFEL